MPYQVQVGQANPQITAVVRCRAAQSELSRVVPACCGEVWTFVRGIRTLRPGRHLAVYFDREINLEVGVEVDQVFTGNDRIVCSSTPAGWVASTIHFGPYHLLGAAHAAVCKWCCENGRALAGPNWEVYGHWNDDPAKLRTDVFYLLRDLEPEA
jgi:effector-binding domain-containing protein